MSREQWGHGYWKGVSDARMGVVREKHSNQEWCDEILIFACNISYGRPDGVDVDFLRDFLGCILGKDMCFFEMAIKHIENTDYRGCYICEYDKENGRIGKLLYNSDFAKEEILKEREQRKEENKNGLAV